ncbi:Vht1p NDAI_0D04220 [Naumovozyma dairenensis CBS 421]|uniref:Major facilitator superfamily (MFS) profile domain-containing protein n=1 Tax=Naumovozyma dairenensis (strain ATCC 10597 / BCRC 20456 / CBS 421 / NBRC 0211 / NRRL Y-12639) TaxID=1071378 RepID=G0WAC5_NAUDC|nr:hypothetical protein NDAI_0D04220 [Naumovozyma dairenensis CBS 421]CCD24736.1 hypothetical protein NDAI_0D04220 [Naumovozyma dairenensis CBS 421]
MLKNIDYRKKFFPHLRILPEDINAESGANYDDDDDDDDDVSSLDVMRESEEITQRKKSSSSNSGADLESFHDENHETFASTNGATTKLQPNIPYELRDENGRKWWKYFDEFEYRINKEYRKSRKWYEFLYPNHTTHSKAERKLLYKLDIVVGFYFLVLCWSKSVDTNNYTNAYVSNMKEDLHMKGNDYIHTSTISNVGAIVFQLPFMYLLPKYPAHIILPMMDLGWTWFTFACYRAKSLSELQAYRFILNAFGAAYYPVSQYILGCWYAPDELTSRVFLFFCGQLLGGVTSGLLQARIFKSLNGVNGLAGWRWMFLIDAIAISLPTAILGFFVIPGIPSKCYSLFLTDEEIRIARVRNKRNQIKDGIDSSKLISLFKWDLWKKVFFTPTFWVLLIFDTCSWNNMTAFSGSYTLWLKSNTKYSIEQVNNLSVLPACLGFAYVFVCAAGADLFHCKWIFMVFAAIMNCISCGLLIKWDIPSNAKWFAFLTTYFSVAPSPCLWSFINDFLRFDPQVKAITWIAIYSFSQSTNAWIPNLAWPTVESPRFKTGYTVCLIFGAIYGAWTFVVLYFYKKNERKHALGNGIILYDSSKQENPPSFVTKEMEQRSDGYYYLKKQA